MENTESFGSIKEIDIRSIWPGEATHFTPWLAGNIQELGNVLEMELEFIDSEVSAGGFSADIVAIDVATNRKIVIENQFGSTDHKHLGQLLTYSSILHADAIIWIAESIRDEHKSAIDFLNQNLSDSLHFYAIEVKLIRIDESKPAYIFTVISKPSIKDEHSSRKSSDISEGREKYRSFFQSLIDELRVTHKFTNAKMGQPQNWYTFASEDSKTFKYSASFALGGRFRTEIYIDTGDKEKNEDLFEYLYTQRSSIEQEFDQTVEWEKLETKRACRVAIYTDASIDDDSDQLESVRIWAIDHLLQLKKVFPKIISNWTYRPSL